MEKVLFYGNGFNNLISTEYSWKNILINRMTVDQKRVFCETEENSKEIKIKNIPYTLLYDLLDIDNEDCVTELRKIETHPIYGEFLEEYDNLITVNFTLEYKKFGIWQKNNIKKENKYNLFHRDECGNKHIWFAHGNLNKSQSMIFGFEQYIGQTTRIKEYLSGSYTYKENKNEYTIGNITDRMKSGDDVKSWIDYFFFPNYQIDIVGFGLDYSEYDLWYILEKRKKINPSNKIIFHTPNSDKMKLEALKSVNVECPFYKSVNSNNSEELFTFYQTVLDNTKKVK